MALDLGLSYSKLRALLRGRWDTPSRISSLLATVSTAVSEFYFCMCHLLGLQILTGFGDTSKHPLKTTVGAVVQICNLNAGVMQQCDLIGKVLRETGRAPWGLLAGSVDRPEGTLHYD